MAVVLVSKGARKMKKFIEWLSEIDLFYLLWFFLILANIVDFSFTASTDHGVSLGVQSKQEQKVEPKKEPTLEDGPKADWK
jgi:hypothetical protein